jgi:hypothetical protein
MVNVFAVPGKQLSFPLCHVRLLSDTGLVYFVVFRETLETSVIVSVLLAFVKQALGQPDQDPIVYNKLVKQVKTIRTIANGFLR